MAAITLNKIEKAFGATQVLKGVSLDIAEGEFIALVGPSGCGKSTLLRILAGLEDHDSGTVEIAGQNVTGIRAADRNLSMVFQSYALYPHLSVRENIAVPLRMRSLNIVQRFPVVGPFCTPGPIKQDIKDRIEDAAVKLDIAHLLDRKPGQLSGGQRQRVALGRALVRDPQAFLLDEPLSNLDAKLRVQTRAEIAQLHRTLNTTFVYVTHDQIEAMTMADRIAVMMDGEILQCDTPDEVYNTPKHVRVAEFVGSPKINIFSAAQLGLSAPEFLQAVKVGVRPEALHVGPGLVSFTAHVAHMENLGPEVLIHISCGSGEGTTSLTARLSPKEAACLSLGVSSTFHFDVAAAHFFGADSYRLPPGDAGAAQSALRDAA